MELRQTIFAILLLFCMASVSADPIPSPRGLTFTAGLSFQRVDFDFYRNSADDTPTGTMTRDLGTSYFLRADSLLARSRDGRWSFHLEAGLTNFDLSRQWVDEGERDLGTRVRGHSAYLVPMAARRFAWDEDLEGRVGVGVGVGYLIAQGEMILTEDGSNERLPIDVNGVDIAVTLLLEGRYRHWVTRMHGGGPYLDRGGHTYSLFGFSWDLGYRFAF